MKPKMISSQDRLRPIVKLLLKSRSRHSGFTLIESLVAIMVIAITVVSITPPIFWATGTRVQNRRAEQALSLAQGKIDEVRSLVERGTYTLADLPSVTADTKSGGVRPYPAGPAPTATWDKKQSVKLTCNSISSLSATDSKQPPVTQYLPVDTDGDSPSCNPDFLIQVFRNAGVCVSGACQAGEVPVAFSVGVRVYGANAAKATVASLGQEKAKLIGTSGTGQTGTKPLAVLYATVAKSNSPQSLQQYRTLCKASGTDTTCD